MTSSAKGGCQQPPLFFKMYKSKYFSNEVKLPTGWTPEEFWLTLEQLEKLESDNLFGFCLELGVIDGTTPKGSVDPNEMIRKILYEGNRDRILNILKKTGGFISQYLSIDYSPFPTGWTSEEFWWTVEQLEKHGDECSLFDLADSLGIGYDKKLRGKVGLDYLILEIIDEGGSKEKIINAIKEFVKKNKK